MPLFNKRSSMLEVQNRALINTAKERAEQIEKLERELQTLRERAEQADKIVRELQSLREEIAQTNKVDRDLQQARSDIERITLERDFYSKKASSLEQESRELTESATKYSVPKAGAGTDRGRHQILSTSPEVGARTHRDGHQIFPVGSKAGTRTQ